MRGEEFDWAAHIEAVARHLRGEPNLALSSAMELRFGTNGSLRVTIAGEFKGTWRDHEAKVGGGVLDLIRRELAISNGAAIEWFKSTIRVEVPEPRIADIGRVTAVYDYFDEDGVCLYQVRRREFRSGNKKFTQFRSDGRGGWVGGKGCMSGVRRVLYRLPEMLAEPERAVFVAEGEKCVLTLVGLGLVATCNSEGAGNWRSDLSEHFRGRSVIILPDNDDAGRSHADDVVRSLLPVAADLRVVNLPDLPPKGDICDWLAAGGTREKLLELVEAAAPVREIPASGPAAHRNIIPFRQDQKKDQPSIDEDDPPETSGYVQNDIGNALMLVERHGRDLAYVLGNGWYLWDGKRYAIDLEGVCTQKIAHEISATLIDDARGEVDKKVRLKKLKWAIACGNGSRISAMLTQAKSYLFRNFDDLDKDPMLLNCQNGTVDLKTGLMGPHLRDDLLSKICGTDYDPRAQCKLWEQFLLEIFDNDEKMVLFIQRAVGYSLTGSTKEQVVFILHGSGSNGKSVFLETIAAVLGDYQEASASETWISKPTGAPTNDVAGLAGARFVSVIETEHDKNLAEALVKQATGGDRMKVRLLYREFFEFLPRFKLWFATNHKPKIRGSDFAIWRRIMLIPFLVKFVEKSTVGSGQKARDPDLKDKLMSEYPGILNWMIRGCQAWQQQGLGPPDAVIAATETYQDSQDHVSAFIRDNCWLGHGLTCAAGLLHASYEVWCEENDEEPISTKAFARNLDDRGLPPVKRTKAARIRQGIDIKEERRDSAEAKQKSKKPVDDGSGDG